MKDYETVDISGDVGLRIFGNNLSELFRNAAHGLYSLITDTSQLEIRKTITVKANGDNRESLLVAFLNELIFHFDTDGFMGKDVRIDNVTSTYVEATIPGEDFDPEKHEGKVLLKAATYHDIRVEESEGIWQAFVMFDI